MPSDASVTPGGISVGTLLAGRYQVTHLLHAGYSQGQPRLDGGTDHLRAIDTVTKRPVHVRVLPPGTPPDDAGLAALRNQTRLAQSLVHKNIAETFGIGEHGDRMFIAAELIDGHSLRHLIHEKRLARKPFSLKAVYNIVAHVANALSRTHPVIPHGALSPERIAVDRAGRVRVVDCAIARLVPAMRLPQETVDPYKVDPYLAPEAIKAPSLADHRSDLYSLGVIIFELLTGQLPSGTRPSASALRREVPASTDNVIGKCLSLDPSSRFASAEEIKRSLHNALAEAASFVPSIPQAVPVQPPPMVPPSPVIAGAGGGAAGPLPGVNMDNNRGPAAPTHVLRRDDKKAVPGPGHDAGPRHTHGSKEGGQAAVDEAEERWLIQKDRLDFGPYSLAEIKRQIERGEIVGEHTMMDNHSGARNRVDAHPLLTQFYAEASRRLEDRRHREAVEVRKGRAHKRSLLTLGLFAILAAVAGVWAYMSFIRHNQPIVLVKEVAKPVSDADLEKVLRNLNFQFPAPRIRTRSKPHGKGKKGAANQGPAMEDFDDPTYLGDASKEGGTGQLAPEQIQQVMNARGKSLALCIAEEKRRNPVMTQIELEFIVHGSGQVTAVRVNGQKTTPIASCMYQKMRAIPFPPYDGPKTVAGFTWVVK